MRIEDVILKYSDRGMTDLTNYIADDFCMKAAKEILSWPRGTVFLTTGFYVAGTMETDGPVGTAALAVALKTLGFDPVILTDEFCKGLFDFANVDTIYVPVNCSQDDLEKLLIEYKPQGMISIERCGRNRDLVYANMRGVNLNAYTAPIDTLFKDNAGKIPTIGVGDGGNEIGMGKIAGAIGRKLSIAPCIIGTDILVIATVSNWGAYGIICALAVLNKKKLVPDFEWVEACLQNVVAMGGVDGVTHEHTISVDGKGMEFEQEIIASLKEIEQEGVKE